MRQGFTARAPVNERSARPPGSGDGNAARGRQDRESVVGLDWGCSYHAVFVVDGQGQAVDRFEVRHDRAGLHQLISRLRRIGSPNALPVAIKRPSGLLVDRPLEAGHPVVPLHPNAVKASRPRYPAALAKSDRGDACMLMSFPRAGWVCAAQMPAEIGDQRQRFLTHDQLAAEAGASPVTKASGKSHAVCFRWAGNKRLRVAVTCFADNSRHASPWAANLYARARARGCDDPHAIRIIAQAWIRVLWRAWHDRQPYNPWRHASAQACAA